MSSIEYRVGDLLEYEGKYICQGVNSLGVMGAGLALQIRNKYPKVYKVYKRKHSEGEPKLGRVFGVDCGEHTIINIVTQKEIGRWKKPFNYTAFTLGLNQVDVSIKGPVAFPMIGAGLAGGDWVEISKILKTCRNIQPIVYNFNDEIPFL